MSQDTKFKFLNPGRPLHNNIYMRTPVSVSRRQHSPCPPPRRASLLKFGSMVTGARIFGPSYLKIKIYHGTSGKVRIFFLLWNEKEERLTCATYQQFQERERRRLLPYRCSYFLLRAGKKGSLYMYPMLCGRFVWKTMQIPEGVNDAQL